MNEHIIPRIQDLCIDVFLSVRKTLNPNDREGTHDLFGLDFLIDEDFRVWLIEVNTNPYLGMPNKYMKEMLPRMLNDWMKMCVDTIYEPKVVIDPDRENDFDCLYREE